MEFENKFDYYSNKDKRKAKNMKVLQIKNLNTITKNIILKTLKIKPKRKSKKYHF